MKKMKNVYSAPGMAYYAPDSLRYLKDCPKCKFGSMDRRASDDPKADFWVCADCGHRIDVQNK